MKLASLDSSVNKLLQEGTVIPAHPLALDEHLQVDEERQRLLTRYYLSCGAGGLAVAVHTTQFAIRQPGINLLEPVLKITAEEIQRAQLNKPFIKVAGICGAASQAIKEAELARKYGYDLGLVSMGGLSAYSESQLVEHVRAIAEIIPVFGFYLQPAAGGRLLSYQFWRGLAEIKNVYAIKVAAFNRYQTLDVVRAVCYSERRNEIALYTGNDDNIVADLLTTYEFKMDSKIIEKKFVGGLLGHWAVWTKAAVNLFKEIRESDKKDNETVKELLTAGTHITDMNAAIFDAANSFHGCIPGIHEVLYRQGLLKGRWCLDPQEQLSPGQLEEIDRVYKFYPQYTDDLFVKKFLQKEQLLLK
ncbi:MAG: dihydrodipicolinate synthase family protein [Bacteroidota bacterium]